MSFMFQCRLATVDLHYRVKYYMRSTKMENANFLISQRAELKFQFLDPDAFYVHHLSWYEHIVHRAEGLDRARIKTLILSTEAFNAECGNLTALGNASTFVVIPFYGTK